MQYIHEKAQPQVRVNSFIQSVYNWMAIGLGLTGITAFFTANSPTMMQLIFSNQLLFFRPDHWGTRAGLHHQRKDR